MNVGLKITQGDVMLQTDFGEPAFDLFRDSWAFYRQLYSRLSRHGLRLSDIKPERGAGSLGDLHLACSLFNFNVAVRIGPERLEVHCPDVNRIDTKNLNEAVVDILEAVKSQITDIAFRTHSLALGIHGMLEGITTRDFVSRYVTATPAHGGPPLGSGIVFYYGAEGERLLSSVTLDFSVVVTDGLFIRSHVVWDGRKVATSTLPVVAEKHFGSVLGQLGLEAR